MPFDPLLRRTAAGLAPRPELTQGALVTGVRLPRYGSGSYFGFLITARCDLAHVRTDTVNLLPIVPLAEWLMFDGCIVILLARVLTLESRLAELAEALSPALRGLIGNEWKAGYELFIAADSTIDSGTKDKFHSALDEFSELSKVLQTKTESPSAVKHALATSKNFQSLVERERPKRIVSLIENKILDAHFLPVVRPSELLGEGPGYVILFRQILSFPGNLLEPLRLGVRSLDDLPDAIRTQAAENLTCPSEIVANVKSPHVEQILQRFANVFDRVGVVDCSKRYREWLVKKTCDGIQV